MTAPTIAADLAGLVKDIQEYGVLRGTAAKLLDLGLNESAKQRDLEASLLCDRITAVLAQAEARIVDQDKQIRDLYDETTHDVLTELLNRKGLAEVWHVDVDHRHSLGLVDLDRFKQINDQYGHNTGDRVLRHVAEALDGRFQFVARLGGDELVIVDRTDRLGDLVHDPLLWRVPAAGRTLTVTGTVGLTEAVSSLAVALGRADLALYRAKASRRGMAVWWSGAVDGQAVVDARPRVRLRDTRVGAA